MAFKGTGKETQIILLDVRRIVFFDEPVLFMYDAVIRQHIYRLVPSGMYRFILGCRDGEQFGKFHPEFHRYVGIFSSVVAFNIFLISMLVLNGIIGIWLFG